MPEPHKQHWDFGDLEQADDKRAADRELLDKTRKATTSVGYTAPEENIAQPGNASSLKQRSKVGRPSKGRSVALSTKITPENDVLLKAIASDGFVIADIIDDVITTYAQALKVTGKYKRFPLSEAALSAVQHVLDDREDTG